MTQLNARLATPEDDKALRELLRKNPMPGRISMSYCHEPSFFDALEVEGHSAKIFVAEDSASGAILGMGAMSVKRLFVNGRSQETGYLSGLRFNSGIRRSTGLARGFKTLRSFHLENAATQPSFYLTSILEDNLPARAALCGGRASLPTYHEITPYHTLSYPSCLAPRRPPKPPRGLRLLNGAELGAEALAAFWLEQGSSKQFFPVYEPSLASNSSGVLRGLKLEDILVVAEGRNILATLGCWDQRPFKQRIVNSYSGLLKHAPLPANLLAMLLNGPAPFPRPGSQVDLLLGVALLADSGHMDLLSLLLDAARHLALRKGVAFLSLGLASGDPFLPCARRPFHFTSNSHIYAVAFDERGETELRKLDRRPLYLELGSL